MRNYIYTFWTKPFFTKDFRNQLLYYNILYLLLSIELTKKISKKITIYTDWYGELILKKFFSDIEINVTLLNSLNLTDVDRWAIPKLYVMNRQTKPFCHIDHDVFLWKDIPMSSDYDIITQCLEEDLYYDFYKKQLVEYVKYNPINDLLLNLIKNNKFYGYNCGYVDVYNLDCAKQWTNFAIDFNTNFKINFNAINCTLIEQLSLYAVAQYYKYNIGVLIDNPINENDQSINKGIAYTHLMGAKNDVLVFEMIKNKLLKENPDIFNKFISYSYNLLLK